MSWSYNWEYKEPTKEEKLKCALEYLQYLEKELSRAKGYWYKLTTKQQIFRLKEQIKE